MLQPCDETIEQQMKFTYDQLSEKDRRLYAAIEVRKLRRGGQSYITRLFGCARKTIRRGLAELRQPSQLPPAGRIRHPGGGRQRVLATHPELADRFVQVLRDYTAGDPMNADIRWTNLTPAQIAAKMGLAHASVHVVKQLLQQHGYVRRQARKQRSTGQCADRDAQFENISVLKATFLARGYPVLSVDAKKKEPLGQLYRDGQLYTREAIIVFDHDYAHLAAGVAIPYTIYDLAQNKAYVYIGTSKDTAAFVCDCLRHWWTHYGLVTYSQAPALLVLADSGGSHSYRHYIFKQELQDLADELRVEIRMAHYPPYCSKWNPVEHRVFPHMTRAMQGVIFTSHELVREVIETTTTTTGLQVVAHVIHTVYETGRKAADDFKDTMRIVFDEYLGPWNYRAIPQPQPP